MSLGEMGVSRTSPPCRSLLPTTLPLDRIATGAATEIGLGPGYEAHGCLDFILQELSRFPGYGNRLIETGLKSPTIRARNMALKALSEWGKDKWPGNVTQLLELARRDEPDQEVRERIDNLIAGKPLLQHVPAGRSNARLLARVRQRLRIVAVRQHLTAHVAEHERSTEMPMVL